MTLVHLETIAGRKVRDRNGKVAGRIEEVHADWRGDECVVSYYELASRPATLRYIARILGGKSTRGAIVVPWDGIDWSDPENPVLK